MLQATLEMEFLHQTLNTHVSPSADSTLQEIYKIISAAYRPGNSGGEANELQRELEQLKLTLTQARRATALQFLCFREKRAQPSANAAGQQGAGSSTATRGDEHSVLHYEISDNVVVNSTASGGSCNLHAFGFRQLPLS